MGNIIEKTAAALAALKRFMEAKDELTWITSHTLSMSQYYFHLYLGTEYCPDHTPSQEK